MKKFKIPRMKIQYLAPEEIMGGPSTCFEAHACVDCYCIAVQCPDGYVCTGLNCPTLDDYND